MADQIQFKVVLPPPAAADVVKRELLFVDSNGSKSFELASNALSSDILSGDQDSQVSVSLVDIDDAGNRSEPSVAKFTLLDKIAPPKPGEMGLVLVGETIDEDATDPDIGG
jgi:hypothetical protein